MLLQLIVNILHLQGNLLRILFIVMTVIFISSVLFPRLFPGKVSFRWAALSGSVYPVFLFLTNAVRPFSQQKEGALRLALILEIVFLLLAFRFSRFLLHRTIKTVPVVLCVYVLSWFFFSKLPVSFMALDDLLYLIVPLAAAVILPFFVSSELPPGYTAKHANYNDVMYRVTYNNWNQCEVENEFGEKFIYDKNARIWKAPNGASVNPDSLNLDDPSRFY